jgi:hypothetical protein
MKTISFFVIQLVHKPRFNPLANAKPGGRWRWRPRKSDKRALFDICNECISKDRSFGGPGRRSFYRSPFSSLLAAIFSLLTL